MLKRTFSKTKLERPTGKRYIVVAGNSLEFMIFCDNRLKDYTEKGIRDFEGAEFCYYTGMDALYGMVFDDIIHYGSFYERKDVDLHRILWCIRTRFEYNSMEDMVRKTTFPR